MWAVMIIHKQSTHQQQKDKEHQAHHLSLMDKEGHRDTANWMETVAERKGKERGL